MANAATFTTDSARRIAAAVRKVEGQPANLVGDPARRTNAVDTWFWAKIGEGGYGAEGGYAWTRMEAVNAVLTETDTTGVMAQEVNGSADVPGGTIVRMQFKGYSTDGDPWYQFQYTPPGGGGGPDFAKHFNVTQSTAETVLWDRDLRGKTFSFVAAAFSGTPEEWQAAGAYNLSSLPMLRYDFGGDHTGADTYLYTPIANLALYIDGTTGFLLMKDLGGTGSPPMGSTTFPVQLRVAVWIEIETPEPIVI